MIVFIELCGPASSACAGLITNIQSEMQNIAHIGIQVDTPQSPKDNIRMRYKQMKIEEKRTERGNDD